MSVYEKNLNAIHERIPQLYDAIMKKKLESDKIDFYVETAKNGMPVLCAKQNGKVLYMNSRYDPAKEAECYVKKYKHVLDYSFMFFFGFGNGLIADGLLREKDKHVNFLFYEPSPQLFLLVLEHYDITPLFDDARFHLVVRGLNDKNVDSDIASHINPQNYHICLFDILPLYEQLFADEEEEIRNKFSFCLRTVVMDIYTAVNFGSSLTYNNIYNMRRVVHCNCGVEFEGVFPLDRPAIVVAAGPSLEKNVRELKKAKGKMLIMAVDSALPYLVSQGIIPDLAVVVDAQKPTVLFEDEKIQKIPLATATEANYKIVEMVKNKIIYISSGCDYYNTIFQKVGKSVYGTIGGGSVATVAFSLAVLWGYRKIILVGQDLALASDKIHAGDVDEDLGKGVLSRQRIEIEGYYGDKVYTLEDYNFYREWYEASIRHSEGLEVVNATEGGAKIEGTIQMSLKEAIDSYDVDSFDFEKTIRDMPPTVGEKHREEIVQMWKESIENLEKLKQRLYDGIRELNKGIQMIRRKQCERSQLVRIRKRIGEINEECEAMMEIYFLNEIVSGEQADVLSDIYIVKDNDEEEICRMFEKMLQYMKAMHGSVDEVKELFERIIEEE